jgi:hypothetical protein
VVKLTKKQVPQNSRQAFLKMEEKRTECAPKCCPEKSTQRLRRIS